MSANNENKSNTNQASPKPEEVAKEVAQKTYSDFLGAYKSFTDTTSKVVEQAATILESEIAAGVKIAQQTESRFPQVEQFRSEPTTEVIQRFRRDAHEVIDIFIDVVGATLKSAPNMAETNLLRIGNVTVKPVQVEKEQRPVIKAPTPVKAGGKAEIQISFENNRNTETEEFALYSTDLISNKGERLPSGLVKFAPASLKIAPLTTVQTTVTVSVPEETTPGTYSGLVLASNVTDLRSEIVIKVE
jgi:hypothetical protein